MSEATKRPWTLKERSYGYDLWSGGWFIELHGGDHSQAVDPVAWEAEFKASCALIVRAVNAHDALVAALEAVEKKLGPLCNLPLAIQAEVRAALRLARGEG